MNLISVSRSAFLFVGVSLLAAAGVANAQGMPPLPGPAEIEQRIQDEIEKLPSVKSEHELITIEYKQLPTDPNTFVKQAAGGAAPPGMDIDQLIKQFTPMARPFIAKAATTIGTLQTTKDLKYGRLTLKAETIYDFGIVLVKDSPVGVVIGGGELKKPVQLKLKRKGNKENHDVHGVEAEPAKKNDDSKINLVIFFNQLRGTAGPFKVK